MIFFTQDIALSLKKRHKPIRKTRREAYPTRDALRSIIMRIQLIILFLTIGLVQVFGGVYGQITIRKDNARLAEVLQDIERQSGYVFIYDETLIDERKVSVALADKSLYEALEACFRELPILYHVVDKNIVLKHGEPEVVVSGVSTLSVPAFFDYSEVRGQVTDSVGNPLPGASVRAFVIRSGQRQNLNVAEVTDRNGHFVLRNIPENAIVVASFIGYIPTEVKAAPDMGRIVLRAQQAQIEDVIVTGLRDIRRDAYTGNAVTVTQEEMLQVGQRNIAEVLQVFDPSFRIEVNNIMGSDPNTLPTFYIRGRSGIGVKALDEVDISEAALTNNPNLPIFIMDGYEVSAERVYDYDVTRIQNITILKDAAATAVYGSRAANGVVVITTVPPKPGRLHVDYNLVSSLTLPDLSDYNLMNAEEKVQAEILAGFYDLESQTNLNNRAGLTDELLRKQNQLVRGVNTDWIAQPLQNEFNQKHTLTFDGGTQDLRFNVLLKYDRQNGVMKESLRERKGAGLIFNYRLNTLQIRNDFNYDIVGATNSPYGVFSDYTWKAPYDEMHDRNGVPVQNTYTWHSGGTDALNRLNPLYEVFNTHNFSTNGYHSLSNNTSLIWDFLRHFQFRADLAVTKQNNRSDLFYDPASGRYTVNVNTDYTTIGQLNINKTETNSINTNFLLRYDNRIGGHNMNFSIGANTRESITKGNAEVYTGFPSGLQFSPNYASKITRKPSYSDNHTRLAGGFVALNYSFNDIYLLDVSGRLDGSSEFGSEQRFAPFWSFGTGINFHNYDWMKAQSVISRLRLAGSVGELGKTNFPPYAAKGMYTVQENWYRTGVGAILVGRESPGLTWEKTNTTDIVFDIGLFNDRVSLNYNWYDKTTHDLVNDVDLPLSAGFSSYKDNIGKIRNRGYEIFLRADIIRRHDFLIGVYGNFASNKNTLLELSNSLRNYNKLVDSQYDGYTGTAPSNLNFKERFSTPHTKYVEGGSLTSIFGMHSLGINPMDGSEIFMKPDGTITYDWNAADQIIIGDSSPKGQGSFGVNSTYKNWSLFASFMYQYGGQEYNSTLLNKVENVDLYNRNADRRVLTERWQKPGDVTPLKNIAERLMTTRPTSRFIQDYNMLRFNSLSISYDVNREFIQRYGLNRFRVQLSSQNLGTISSILQERGLSYPFARTYDLSVKIVL